MKVEYINCWNCGKLIEKKGNRTLCIACTNKRSKEMADARRKSKEYKEHYNEWKMRRGE